MPKNRFLLPLLATALALGACGDQGTTGLNGDASRVSLLLTDAPGEMKAAVVTITDIYLQGAEGDSTRRVYLRQGGEVTTNLLSLSNDVLQLVDDKPIPAGSYSQLRFVVTGGYIEVEKAGGGTTLYATSPDYAGLPAGAHVDGELKCPSCAQSGFKVLLDRGEQIDLTGDRTLLVDFDVSQSFGKPAGNSGKWILRPVLKATELHDAASVTVTLAADWGVVLPVVSGSQLTLGAFSATLASDTASEAKTVPLTDEDHNGTYEARFRYLAPGTYHIGFTGPAGITFTTDQVLPFAVTVSDGASTTAAFTLSGATAL